MKVRGIGGRQLAARLLGSLNMDRLVLDKDALRIVVYHRIMDECTATNYPFDCDLIDATIDEFDREIGYLSKNYEIVTFADVINTLDQGTPLPERAALITLDDGYQDNYINAFPVLRRHAVPATLLLAAGYIGGGETFWYDKLAFILMNTKSRRLEYDSGRKVLGLSDDVRKRLLTFRMVMKDLAGVEDWQRLSILDEINSKYGVVYDELGDEIKALSMPLTWQQVSEMKDGGIDIGSHTMTHPFLSRVSMGELSEQLLQSKVMIEGMTGAEVKVIAYPNGQREDFTEQVKKAARDAGYSIGLSYIDGVNRLSSVDRYEMHRLHVSPRHDFSVFRMTLSWPAYF